MDDMDDDHWRTVTFVYRLFLCAVLMVTVFLGVALFVKESSGAEIQRPECVKVGEREWRCGKEEDWEKSKKITHWYYEVQTIKARFTKYSRFESCHNPIERGGKRTCLTAGGHDTRTGYTVACPRDVPFGSAFDVFGGSYRCDDRTASWVQKKYGPTFDIFTEDHEEAVQWGVKRQEVTIFYSH